MDEKFVNAVKEARREILKNSVVQKLVDEDGKLYSMVIYEVPELFKEAVANISLAKGIRIKLFISKTHSIYDFIPEKEYPYVRIVNKGQTTRINANYDFGPSK